VLSVERLRREGISLPPVREAVRGALVRMREAEARARGGSVGASEWLPHTPQNT
jgi:hypothetical protein